MRRLDEIEARANGATPGPWGEWASDKENGISPAASIEVDICRAGQTPEDAENLYFISRARTDVPTLVAALKAVLALADHVTETHAALPEPHGAFTRGYATALRDIRAAIEGALLP